MLASPMKSSVNRPWPASSASSSSRRTAWPLPKRVLASDKWVSGWLADADVADGVVVAGVAVVAVKKVLLRDGCAGAKVRWVSLKN